MGVPELQLTLVGRANQEQPVQPPHLVGEKKEAWSEGTLQCHAAKLEGCRCSVPGDTSFFRDSLY